MKLMMSTLLIPLRMKVIRYFQYQEIKMAKNCIAMMAQLNIMTTCLNL